MKSLVLLWFSTLVCLGIASCSVQSGGSGSKKIYHNGKSLVYRDFSSPTTKSPAYEHFVQMFSANQSSQVRLTYAGSLLLARYEGATWDSNNSRSGTISVTHSVRLDRSHNMLWEHEGTVYINRQAANGFTPYLYKVHLAPGSSNGGAVEGLSWLEKSIVDIPCMRISGSTTYTPEEGPAIKMLSVRGRDHRTKVRWSMKSTSYAFSLGGTAIPGPFWEWSYQESSENVTGQKVLVQTRAIINDNVPGRVCFHEYTQSYAGQITEQCSVTLQQVDYK